MSGYEISDDLLFGNSEPMRRLRQIVERLAQPVPPLLIEGESGTGKEVLARAIHRKSDGQSRAFLKISCVEGSFVPALEEAAAVTVKAGALLIDSVCDLAIGAQASLMGALETITARNEQDILVISTATKPLEGLVTLQTFRQDLYYRLAAVRLRMPALRERRVDIPAIAYYYLDLYSKVYQRRATPISERLMKALLNADWGGNIRQLENAVKQYVVLGSEETIVDVIKEHDRPGGGETVTSLKALRRDAVRNCEYKAILASLNRNQWNRVKTARELNVSYRSLLYAMKHLGLPAKHTRSEASGEPARETGSSSSSAG